MPTNPPLHDFTGKNKKAKTYDADWVFNSSAGAWMTKKQNRRAVNDLKQSRAARRARNNAGAVPAAGGERLPPTTGPIIPGTPVTGGRPPLNPPNEFPGNPPPYTPVPDPTKSGVPSWWINQTYLNPTTEEQRFANAANAILPTLSPEDQRSLGMYLANNFKDIYGGYANANFGPIPTKLTNERQTYLNPQRAQAALSLLDRMKAASGTQNMGKGYDFLRNAVSLMTKYNTGGPMTREQYNQFAAAVSALSSQAGKDISAYSNLAQMFNLPTFSAGPLVSTAANNKLFA